MTAWLRLDAGTIWDPRILGLPSDEARWTYIEALCFAKLQTPEGVYQSSEQYAAVTGRSASVLEALLASGLLKQDDAGNVWIGGWDDVQTLKDKTGPQRQRRWRARQLEARDALRNALRNGLPDRTKQTETLSDPDGNSMLSDGDDTNADNATPTAPAAADVIRAIVFSRTGAYPDDLDSLMAFPADLAVKAVRAVAGTTDEPNEHVSKAADLLAAERDGR